MKTAPADGILNVDKPYGLTSMEVVRRIKRASGIKRVGHGGTLDPVATGVIAVCLGQATRVMEYLVDSTKEYRGVVELGVSTDTYDALGQITGTEDTSSLTSARIEQALESFRGTVQQVPPMFSAIKKQGRRLYDLARAGIEVERDPRKVQVFRLQLLDWSPSLVTVEVECGRGFYMRSLAHDLGQKLGCGGHLKSLIRLRSGPFEISEALSLPDMEQSFSDGSWRESLHAADAVLYNLRSIIVGGHLGDRIAHGHPLPSGLRIPTSRPHEKCRVYGVDGRFLAIVAFNPTAKQWQPEKVFAASSGPAT